MIIRNILIVLEGLLLLSFLAAFPVFNLGNIAGIGVSMMLMAATIGFGRFSEAVKKLWQSTGGKIGLITLVVLIAAGLCLAVFLSIRMISAMNREPEKGDVVVVLGCQVKGERPSRMLARRLDAALEYLNSEPEALVIVSGGKGADEKISEAECMRRYLEENGIAPERIIMEDKSTTTAENLEFSFNIMDERGLGRDIILVTDGYHQHRAQLIAKAHGAGRIGALSAGTGRRFIPTYWVREWFALCREAFR